LMILSFPGTDPPSEQGLLSLGTGEQLDRSIDAVRVVARDRASGAEGAEGPRGEPLSEEALGKEAASLEAHYQSLLAGAFLVTGERDRLRIEAEAGEARLLELIKQKEHEAEGTAKAPVKAHKPPQWRREFTPV